MRVTASNPLTGQTEVAATSNVKPVTEVAAPSATAAALESNVLKPAQEALAAMPEIDQAKVAAVRDALARGEISFDAGRLASLIQRFHGGRG